MRQRDLPREVVGQREAAAALHDAERVGLQPAIDAHLAAYDAVIDDLVSTHRSIADTTDLDIADDTRWAAMWLLSGRCLAIARVLIHDMRGGFASEAIGSVRALHEANQLLMALSFRKEDADLKKWLAGEWVRPKTARQVIGRIQQWIEEQARESGIEPEPGDLVELGRDLYDNLSQIAHHCRDGLRDSFSPTLRNFAYGPHPSAGIRASYVNYVGEQLEETLLMVGDSFASLLGRWYYAKKVKPLQQQLKAVRERFPLPD